MARKDFMNGPRCDECDCLLPAHYGSCSHVDPEVKAMLAELEIERAAAATMPELKPGSNFTASWGPGPDRDAATVRIVREALEAVGSSIFAEAALLASDESCLKLYRLLKA